MQATFWKDGKVSLCMHDSKLISFLSLTNMLLQFAPLFLATSVLEVCPVYDVGIMQKRFIFRHMIHER